MQKTIPIDRVHVYRVGSLSEWRHRTSPEEISEKTPVLASMRDLYPGTTKAPTIREAFCP